jgi:N-terminal half of MaoC dehydratase
MRIDAKGTVLFEGEREVGPERVGNVTAAIGGGNGDRTALIVPFFGPTIGGDTTVTDPAGLALDLSRGLLAGVSYEWHRSFVAGETVRVRVLVEDVHSKGSNLFGVVATEFSDTDGEIIHRQTATFIERGAA